MEFLETDNFDGIDVDWKYCHDGTLDDCDNYSLWCKLLWDEFNSGGSYGLDDFHGIDDQSSCMIWVCMGFGGCAIAVWYPSSTSMPTITKWQSMVVVSICNLQSQQSVLSQIKQETQTHNKQQRMFSICCNDGNQQYPTTTVFNNRNKHRNCMMYTRHHLFYMTVVRSKLDATLDSRHT